MKSSYQQYGDDNVALCGEDSREEIKTLGDAWKITARHKLGRPHLNSEPFDIAHALLKLEIERDNWKRKAEWESSVVSTLEDQAKAASKLIKTLQQKTNERRLSMQLPTATCSACGAAVSVSGREEKDVKFSTDTEAGTEKTQILIHVETCTNCVVAEGQEKYINLNFSEMGELDGMPEQVSEA